MALTDTRDVFSKVQERFKPEAAPGMDAVFQFDITGEGGGNWNITIKDGTCQVREGRHDAPTVALAMSSETWLAMANKELSGMQAFMTGKLKVKGDIMLAQKMPNLFSL